MRTISIFPQLRYKAKHINVNFEARRYFTPTMTGKGKLQPAARVAGTRQDVWYVRTQLFFILPLEILHI